MVDHKGKIRVFVYGTLKQGHGLHKLIERGNHEYLGRTYIDSNYMMADMGAYPALVADHYDPEATYRVFGELYTVDHETLQSLDFAEGHPRFYKRQRLHDKDDVPMWVYILQDKPGEYAEDWIDTGVWKPSEGEAKYVRENVAA